MKTATLFTSLVDVDININFFEIEKGLYITTDEVIKQDILKNAYSAIGGLEYHSIIDKPVIAFAKLGNEINDENKDEVLKNFLFHLDIFILSLWMVKDNSIYKELGYLKYENDQRFYSNFIAQINSTCLGQKTLKGYTIPELNIAREYYKFLKDYAWNENNFKYSNLTPDSTRISRFYYYLHGARLLQDIGFKYSLYCTALESLLITKSKNVVQTLAMRIEHLLQYHILHVKSYVYKAYAYRSQILHGNTFQITDINKEEKLLHNLVQLDHICRIIFQMLHKQDFREIFLNGNDEIEHYFDSYH